MDGKREGHGRIGRAFCSAHFREVPVLLRERGPGASPTAGPGATTAGPAPGAQPAAPRRRYIDAFRAEAERAFGPGEGRAAPREPAAPISTPEPASPPPAALPPNADMVADGVEAVTCLDYGVRCTGWLCPLFALPTVPPEDLLAEAMDAERRRWRRRDAGRRRPPTPPDPADPTPPGTPPSHSF